MTATDELRALLDERDIEYYTMPSISGTNYFFGWVSECGGYTKCVGVQGNCYYARWEHLTPEQAIEVTLGRRECKVDVLNTGDCAGYECGEYIMHCNACGHEFGHVLYNEDGDVWMSEQPNFCPHCGARVVQS